MNIKEDIKPISYLKSHAADILKKINDSHRPIIITQNGEAKGVFIDTDSYQKLKDTISFMKMIILSEKEFSEGKYIPQKDVFKELDEKFNSMKSK